MMFAKLVCMILVSVQVRGFNIDTRHPIILSASGEGFGHSLEFANQVGSASVSSFLFYFSEWEYPVVCGGSTEHGEWRKNWCCLQVQCSR